jgi:hypothetical protein
MWIAFDLHSPATDPFGLEGYRPGLAFGLDAFDLDSPPGPAFDDACDLDACYGYLRPGRHGFDLTCLDFQSGPGLTFDGCLRPTLAFDLDLDSLSMDLPSTWIRWKGLRPRWIALTRLARRPALVCDGQLRPGSARFGDLSMTWMPWNGALDLNGLLST